MLFQDFFRSSHSSQQGFFDFRTGKCKSLLWLFAASASANFCLRYSSLRAGFGFTRDIKACASSFVMDGDGLTAFLARIKASYFHPSSLKACVSGCFIFKKTTVKRPPSFQMLLRRYILLLVCRSILDQQLLFTCFLCTDHKTVRVLSISDQGKKLLGVVLKLATVKSMNLYT